MYSRDGNRVRERERDADYRRDRGREPTVSFVAEGPAGYRPRERDMDYKVDDRRYDSHASSSFSSSRDYERERYGRDREREGSWGRPHDRERDRPREEERYRERERPRSGDRERERERERDLHRAQERSLLDFSKSSSSSSSSAPSSSSGIVGVNAKPSSTIMIRGLPPNSSREEVGEAMKPFGQVQSVVIISDRGREVHRGIAFIAFARLEDAVACYKAHPVRSGKPRMTVCGRDVSVHYSVTERQPRQPVYSDWLCRACNSTNFAKRNLTCYHCGAKKPRDSELQIVKTFSKHAASSDTDTLLVSGMSFRTLPEAVQTAFVGVGVPFEDLNIGNDIASGKFLGLALVRYQNVDLAKAALSKISPNFTIGGQKVTVAFYEPTASTTVIPGKCKWAIACTGQLPPAAADQANAFLSSLNGLVAPVSGGAVAAPVVTPATTPVASAPVLPVPAQIKLGIPDEQDYVFDESSGYYYNAKINYYYDTKTSYFFNATTQQYFLFDPTTQAFMPYDSDTSSTEMPQSHAVTPVKQAEEPLRAQSLKQLSPAPTIAPVTVVDKPTIIIKQPVPEAAKPGPAVCTLCQRKFPSQEALDKHVKLSALHKKNLELQSAKRARGEEVAAGQPDQKRARRD